MQGLLTGLRTALLLALLIVLGVMLLTWNAVSLLLYPLLPAEYGRVLGRSAATRFWKSFFAMATAAGLLRFDTGALDRFGAEPGLIVIANHPSMLDAPLLIARLPKSVCIMKAELLRNPFLGPAAKLARYIRNDSPRSTIRLAVADLRHGGQLLIFPEGTRTTRWPVNPFRPGVTLIAKLAGAPIQTVFIDTDSPYLGKGWPLWRLPPLPIVFSVRVGRRFAPAADPVALLQELEDYVGAGVLRGRKTPC